MFLTQAEIAELTGLTQPAAQERALQEMGLTAWRNPANRVILAREALVRWQLGERTSQRAVKEPQVKIRSHA